VSLAFPPAPDTGPLPRPACSLLSPRTSPLAPLPPCGGAPGDATSSIPPLDGEGGAPFGAPGGVSTPAAVFDPPPRRRKAASDLPARGRYGDPHPGPPPSRGRERKLKTSPARLATSLGQPAMAPPLSFPPPSRRRRAFSATRGRARVGGPSASRCRRCGNRGRSLRAPPARSPANRRRATSTRCWPSRRSARPARARSS
jgi:hypothetical protein